MVMEVSLVYKGDLGVIRDSCSKCRTGINAASSRAESKFEYVNGEGLLSSLPLTPHRSDEVATTSMSGVMDVQPPRQTGSDCISEHHLHSRYELPQPGS